MKLVHLGFNPTAMMVSMANSTEEAWDLTPHEERRKQQRERKHKVKERDLDRRNKRQAKRQGY